MGQTCHSFNSGDVRGIIHFSLTDAKFKYNNQSVMMCYHRHLGPSFEINKKGEQTLFSPDDSPEFNPLWEQFDGWWQAKGKALYA